MAKQTKKKDSPLVKKNNQGRLVLSHFQIYPSIQARIQCVNKIRIYRFISGIGHLAWTQTQV